MDTIVGMAFSNLIAIAIMITTAATFHANGMTDIQSSSQAAEAFKPVAGVFAELVFALGIIGTGLLAVPVFAGSSAYAIGEGRKWPVGLSRKPKKAIAFYSVLRCFGGARHWAQFYADRSDQGSLLERGDQWRPGGACHGSSNVVGAQKGRHG